MRQPPKLSIIIICLVPQATSFFMDVWWFPTISYVKIGSHPIDGQPFVVWSSRWLSKTTIIPEKKTCYFLARVSTWHGGFWVPVNSHGPKFWSDGKKIVVSTVFLDQACGRDCRTYCERNRFVNVQCLCFCWMEEFGRSVELRLLFLGGQQHEITRITRIS